MEGLRCEWGENENSVPNFAQKTGRNQDGSKVSFDPLTVSLSNHRRLDLAAFDSSGRADINHQRHFTIGLRAAP
jgi:hypothetical protein